MGCCARAASGHVAAAPPMSVVMKSRRFRASYSRASDRKNSTPRKLLRCGISIWSMSAAGQEQTSPAYLAMAALHPKAHIANLARYVCFVPKADLCTAAEAPLFDHLVGAGKQRGRKSMQGVSTRLRPGTK